MTDVENLEKIILEIFGVKKHIKKKFNTNKCIQPLAVYPMNMFAFNFVNRLSRLNEKFKNDKAALNTICERVKNLGEARDSGWAGPYSEIVALDFYSQFPGFSEISYINLLDIKSHRQSIPALNGQKEKIDIDLCLFMKSGKIFTDVKSFNCVHQIVFDKIFESVEAYAAREFSRNILIGVDNLSSLDYLDVKNCLVSRRSEIETLLKNAVKSGKNFVSYSSGSGLAFNFRIGWPGELMTVKDYSPFAMAQAYRYKFLDYGNKLVDNEYSLITMVRNPWFNEETVDFGNFNNMFYRSLSRRTFMELEKNQAAAKNYSSAYKTDSVRVCDVSRSIAGIVFIDDNSVRSKYYKSLYSAYVYLNPNYRSKPPLTIRMLEKCFRGSCEVQIKDFDDFKWDNY
ncbi:hypothetical protein [Treponema sp.]|uniref:hypothetical protein n=1 Tax=Treponema sp. TaxID=166 RepID=UPI003F097570